MLHFRARTLLWALLVFSATGSAAAPEADGRMRIGGSGGALATLQLLADGFRKTQPSLATVIVPSLGSGGGIKAVLAGAIDLAVASRPLSNTEQAQGALATGYARTPFVFATSLQTKASAITTRDLLGIYSGKLKTWPDGQTLRLVLRPENESDTAIVKSMSPAMGQAVEASQARAGMVLAVTDKASADMLESVHGTIGTTTLAQIISEKRALQPLALDGVVPSLQTLDDASYPYAKTFSLVTAPLPGLRVRQFIAFVRSPAGKRILEKNGHLALPGN